MQVKVMEEIKKVLLNHKEWAKEEDRFVSVVVLEDSIIPFLGDVEELVPDFIGEMEAKGYKKDDMQAIVKIEIKHI